MDLQTKASFSRVNLMASFTESLAIATSQKKDAKLYPRPCREAAIACDLFANPLLFNYSLTGNT